MKISPFGLYKKADLESDSLNQDTPGGGEPLNENPYFTKGIKAPTPPIMNLNPFSEGTTEIWYWKQEFAREFLLENFGQIDPSNLSKTHSLIFKVDETNLESIYYKMQGEIWSPKGEARELITKSGTGHTSMSVGDIIKIGNSVYVVSGIGFKKLQ